MLIVYLFTAQQVAEKFLKTGLKVNFVRYYQLQRHCVSNPSRKNRKNDTAFQYRIITRILLLTPVVKRTHNQRVRNGVGAISSSESSDDCTITVTVMVPPKSSSGANSIPNRTSILGHRNVAAVQGRRLRAPRSTRRCHQVLLLFLFLFSNPNLIFLILKDLVWLQSDRATAGRSERERCVRQNVGCSYQSIRYQSD